MVPRQTSRRDMMIVKRGIQGHALDVSAAREGMEMKGNSQAVSPG